MGLATDYRFAQMAKSNHTLPVTTAPVHHHHVSTQSTSNMDNLEHWENRNVTFVKF